MPSKWSPAKLKKRASGAYYRVGGSDTVRRRVILTDFASKHDLVYFHSVSSDDDRAPVIRGATATVNQRDSNFCIGTHAGYDMALIERAADVRFVGFETTAHKWYVLEIDLKRARNLPFIFLGTRQLTKAFYAKVLTSRRNIRYIQLDSSQKDMNAFHGTYALIASPSELATIYRLFTHDVIDSIAAHKHPFTVEIEGDSLIIFTEADKPSAQLADKLLHYGLWLAKTIDEQIT